MKNKLLTLCICLLVLTSCKEGSNKSSVSETSLFSSKSSPSQIITYYNQIIDYDANASPKISKFLDSDFKTLSKMTKAKSKNKGFITWTSFIGIDPRVENWSSSNKINILKPSELLHKDLADKVLPLITGMNNSYKETKEAYLDFKKYYKNEDYKDDNWKKASKLLELMNTKSANYYQNRNDFFKTFEVYIDKAEEDVLEDHPIKDEIIHAKRTLKLLDNTISLIEDENISIEKIEENYTKLEARFNESKTLDTAALTKQDKEKKFKSFYDAIDDFLGVLRKVKRDKKITDREYRDLGYEYKSVVRDYNYFVK